MHNNMLYVNIYNTTIKKKTIGKKKPPKNMQLHWNLSD